jgi:hypothetical protein
MSTVRPTSLSFVILFDPSDKHTTLDEDGYYVFRRFTTFNDIRNLIDREKFAHIDLHVPTDFTFDYMRQNPEVYIHTYFVDNEEFSVLDETEREKIRDSIRLCCATVGEEFIERGVMDSNSYEFNEGLNLAEQILQINIDQRNRFFP